MHEAEKSHKKYFYYKLAIYFILSVCTFVFRHDLVENLKYFIGTLMIIYRLEEFLFEIIYKGKDFWKAEKLFLGFVEFIFGVFLVFAEIDIETTCIIWASWAIVRESFEIRELVVEVKSLTLTIISGIESVAVIVLSFMLILEAGEHHAMIHLYLLLVELILTPLVPLLDEIFEDKKKKTE